MNISFEKLVGQNIRAIIPSFGSMKPQVVKLHGVEAGGLWVESQQATNDMLTKISVQASPKTVVMFVPYHQINVVFATLDSPSLNEAAFDV